MYSSTHVVLLSVFSSVAIVVFLAPSAAQAAPFNFRQLLSKRDDDFDSDLGNVGNSAADEDADANNWPEDDGAADSDSSSSSSSFLSRSRRAGPNSVLSQETFFHEENLDDDSVVGSWANAAFKFVQNLKCGPDATLFR